MNKIAKAIAVSLSTFITVNATTVVHLGEKNKYYGFDLEKKRKHISDKESVCV